MPLIKSTRLRSDTISPEEFASLLAKLPPEEESIRGVYREQEFNIPVKMFRCLLILFWLYGRRIEELLLLKRKDIRWDENYFWISVFALKRKDTFTKKRPKPIPMSNPYVSELVEYCNQIHDGESYLFPGASTGERVRRVVARDRQTGAVRVGVKGKKLGVPLTYEYRSYLKGTMSSERAWKCLKFLAPDLWLHFFRTTNAKFLADLTGDPFLMRDWYDWTTIAPADSYVRESEARAKKAGDLRKFD